MLAQEQQAATGADTIMTLLTGKDAEGQCDHGEGGLFYSTEAEADIILVSQFCGPELIPEKSQLFFRMYCEESLLQALGYHILGLLMCLWPLKPDAAVSPCWNPSHIVLLSQLSLCIPLALWHPVVTLDPPSSQDQQLACCLLVHDEKKKKGEDI